MEKLDTGKKLIIAEAEKKFRKDVDGIEKHLLTVPSKEKYIQLEKEIVYKILHKEPDDHDCVIDTSKGGSQERYFKIRRGISYPLEFIEEIRRHYELYLTGIVNFNGKSLMVTEVLDEPVRECLKLKGEDGKPVFGEPKLTIEWPYCEAIIDAVRFFLLEEWLENWNKERRAQPVEPTFASLFINAVNGTKLIALLKDHEDLDEKGLWVVNGAKKKIGTAFWVLDDMKYLKPGKDLTRMRTFCKGLGLTKTDDQLRNILKRPEYDPHLKDDYLEFKSLFGQLK